jgi:hypothetical protein
MAHELSDLFAELDAAKAGLQRSVKRCRTFLGARGLPAVTKPDAPKSAFGWTDRNVDQS